MQPATYRVVEQDGVTYACIFLTQEQYKQVSQDLAYAHKRRTQDRMASRKQRGIPADEPVKRGGRGTSAFYNAVCQDIDFTPGSTGVAIEMV